MGRWPTAIPVLRRVLPIAFLRWWAGVNGVPFRFPVGRVGWGDLRRATPLSREFGYDRGTPVDRYYIERFLARHAADVRGRVLEVKDAGYTRRFGAERVRVSDVVDIDAANPEATIVADLAGGEGIPSGAFDCIVFTQVLQLIYEAPAALATLYRALRPGGVLLLTVPGISQVAYASLGATWYWAFTEASVRRMLGEHFPESHVAVEIHGNVFAAAALIYGLASEEVAADELDARDEDYQVILTARVVKPSDP